MADEKWKDITFNIPSLLPLQAVPQEPDAGKMLAYLQSLHNYLADDRAKIARAINVIAYFRNLFGIEAQQPASSDSKALWISEDTLRAYLDTDAPGSQAWHPLTMGSEEVELDTTDFDSILSSAEDTLQKAMDVLDDNLIMNVAPSEPADGDLDNGQAILWYQAT